MIISDIKQAVKNQNRANVFVDGKYSFSLDISQVVDFKLKVGQKITEEQLLEYKKASELGKLYQRTLEWVLIRPRSERETRDYLRKKLKSSSSEGSSQGACPSLTSSEESFKLLNDIISRLQSKGYLDDTKFAEYYVENRFVKKGISQKRLRMELIKKGIAKDIIDTVIDSRNDEEEIHKIIAKKRSKYDDDKLIRYLCRQGFSYQLAQSLVACGKD